MVSIDLVPSPAYDTVVVGGGQAGLAVGHQLQQRGLDVVILDAGPSVGHTWASRWDSLRLFTPAEYDALPGLSFPGSKGSYPTKDEVAAYLRRYAETFHLPVVCDAVVTRVEHDEDGFTLTSTRGTVRARHVVIATGPFQEPAVPAFGAELDPDVPQLHSSAYRNPAQLPSGHVLVVGAANSGLQIADELRCTHHVTIAVGSRPPQLPQRLLGRDLFHWLTDLGLMQLPATHRIARRLRAKGDAVIGTRMRSLRRHGAEIRPRLVGFTGRAARFADGSAREVDAVVWATGYRSSYGFLDIPGALVDGQPAHDAGASTAVEGLFFVGLPWQTTRGSALLGFVGDDAARIASAVGTAARHGVPAPRGDVEEAPATSPRGQR